MRRGRMYCRSTRPGSRTRDGSRPSHGLRRRGRAGRGRGGGGGWGGKATRPLPSGREPSPPSVSGGAAGGKKRGGGGGGAPAMRGIGSPRHTRARLSDANRWAPSPFVNPFPFVSPFVIPRRAAARVDVSPFTRPWGAEGAAILLFFARPFVRPRRAGSGRAGAPSFPSAGAGGSCAGC